MRLFLLTSLIFFLAACEKNGSSISLNNLEIYAPLPGNTVTSGYTKITNNTDVTISIDSITSPDFETVEIHETIICLLYTSPSPRDAHESRMPSSA